MQFPKLEKNLALMVTLHFLGALFLMTGFATCLAFLVTAKWYGVAFGILSCAGGWFILYQLEEKWTSRQKSQNPITETPTTQSFHWQPGLK